MSVVDAKESLRLARAFARDHLAECAFELLAWKGTGVLADGRMRELAAMLRVLDKHDHLQLAEGEIARAALERVAAAQPAVNEGAVDLAVTSDLAIRSVMGATSDTSDLAEWRTGIEVTHLPTGVVVTCTHERSKHANREAALCGLRAILTATRTKE